MPPQVSKPSVIIIFMIQKDISLKEYSSFKIGGSAKYFLQVSNKEELIAGLKEWENLSIAFPDEEKRIFVLGGGTNLLISDNGFSGFVIQNSIKFIERNGDVVTVGSGVLVSDFLNFCIENSLSGFEWAGGLPGSIGGAVRGNAGAFGGETKDSVFKVESLDLETLGTKTRDNPECNFGYRDSIFKSGEGKKEIIISVSFKLAQGDSAKIKKIADEKINYRKNRHPLSYPNAGSVFKNVKVSNISAEVLRKFKNHIKNDPFPVIPAASILSRIDLKGKRIGGAKVSEDHPNFIVNVDNAISSDVKDLIELEKEAVKEKLGIELEVEINFLE